jgi:hypothetical protein
VGSNRQSSLTLLWLLYATGLGAFLRIYPALAVDFPLKDGGLFYTFILELQQNGYIPPPFSSYNQAGIPFAYPPLSFYLVGVLSGLFGWPVLSLLRILPAAISILTLPAFFLLARSLLSSDRKAVLATFSFALLSTAFDFLIVGGGLPRSLAYLFSLLALRQVKLLYEQPARRHVVLAILFSSLVVLSHPVVAWFTVYSAFALFMFYGRNTRGMLTSGLIAFGTFLLTMPWWVMVLARYSPAPFLQAAQPGFRSWINLVTPLLFLHTNEPYVSLQAVMGLVGLFACLSSRRYFLPAWLGLVFLLEPRLAASYSALPMSLLVAIGLDDVILEGIRHLSGSESPKPAEKGRLSLRFSRMIPQIMLGFFLLYAFVSAYVASPKIALSAADRSAMQWVGQQTPENSRFLVISAIEGAGEDLVSEWFPAITRRISLGTPQGFEWIDGPAFSSRWRSHDVLQGCASRDVNCLEEWSRSSGSSFDYIYLSQAVHPQDEVLLLESLHSSPAFVQVYNNAQVDIFQVVPIQP